MLNYIFYRIGQFIALCVPLKISYRVAIFISDLRYFFALRDRREVTANLRVIFPEKSLFEIRKIRIRLFRNFAKYLVDFFRFSKLNADYIKKNVKLENIGFIDEGLSHGKGGIAVSAHLGNWELGGVAVALLGYPIWAVTLVHKYKNVDKFFNFQRESKGMRVIPLGKAVRKCLDVLAQNGIVALVGDRDFTEKGLILDFFGKPAIFPPGPAAFALKTGAAVVPVFMIRNPDDSFTLKLERPIYFSGTGEKDTDLINAITVYKRIFEDYIRKYPDQWYMFRRFWTEK